MDKTDIARLIRAIESISSSVFFLAFISFVLGMCDLAKGATQ